MPATPTVTILDASRVQWTTELVTLACYACAVPFAMPRSLHRDAKENPDHGFWCPNGHEQCFRESEADRLRKKLTAATSRADAAERTAARQRNRAIDAERSASAYKGVATRQRNRIARGVCPCCNRQFPNMRDHMAVKHPDYAGAPLVPQ